ncbi:MAG: hypothetical protein U9N50_02810 [Pseudomonadota bacterium]|nr:hypothetical protein [Pseudomonadota bacterium]
MKKLFVNFLLAVSLVICSASHAEDFRLDFNDTIFGGFHTVDLHRALYEQYQVDANRLEVEHIEVVLKSRYGGGLAWTGSPYSQRDRRVVTGQAANYYNPAGWNFSRIVFPAKGSADDLLLNLYGQIRLREVLVRTRD